MKGTHIGPMLAVSDLAVSWEVWPPHPLPAAFSWEDSGSLMTRFWEVVVAKQSLKEFFPKWPQNTEIFIRPYFRKS